MQPLLRSHGTSRILSQSWRRSLLAIARAQQNIEPRAARNASSSNLVLQSQAQQAQQPATAPATKKPRRSLADKNPITLTDRAAERIRTLLKNQPETILGLRLGVQRRGCNGLSYTMNYKQAAENAKGGKDDDLEMESHGIRIFIEPMALLNIIGTQMDWEESELASEFTFHNPNSKGQCGCGESFTV